MDNLEEQEPENKDFIYLSEDWEVKWWTKNLGVSVNQLKQAVAEVGNSAAKVKEHLQEKN